MKTIIYTTYDCLIKAPSWEKFVKENDNLCLDEFPSQMYVYPTGKSKLIPFVLSLQERSPLYRVIEKSDKRFVFLIDGLYTQTIQKHSFSYNGKSSEVEISTKEIHFSTKHTKKIITLPSGSSNFKCGSLYHIIYVTFSRPNSELMIAFNILNGRTKTFEGSTILHTDKEFSIASAQGEKTVLYIDKEGLKVKEKIPSSKVFSNPLYVAKNFMEEIKDGEFDCALSYLSSSLQESQSQQSLQEYFGEVSLVFPIDPYTIFTLSNGEGKLYTFEIDKGKIVDICD